MALGSSEPCRRARPVGVGRRCTALVAVYLAIVLGATPRAALAFPGVLVAKDGAFRTVRTSHVALLRRDALSVVTVTADFAGPVAPMAWLLPVPADVTLERIRTAKREFIGRLEQLTAPRYHEFFEKNPCEPGEAEQEWEYLPKVEEPGLQVGTRLLPREEGPVAREIGLRLSSEFADTDSPYTFHLLTRPRAAKVRVWLEARGYQLRPEADRRIEAGLDGQNLLVAEVNPARLGLVPGGAELGAIRYWSELEAPIAATLGLLHSSGRQDLIVYVLAPDRRYAAENYENLVFPSNLSVAPGANERLSDLHDALSRAHLVRRPRTALTEFAWSTDGCGEPCPNGKLLPYELLSLGADVVEERLVSVADRTPRPLPETERETAYWSAKRQSAKPAERTRIEHEHEQYRKELARRMALLGRHRYVLTRLRWNYDAQGMPENPRLVPAPSIQGGVGAPRGPKAELVRDARPAAENRFQVRYVRALPWTGPTRCEEAERWRWGRRWASLGRSWHKVWTATQLGGARSGAGDAKTLLITPLPEIGWGTPSTSPPRQPERPSGGRGCGCNFETMQPLDPAWAVLFVLILWRRRRSDERILRALRQRLQARWFEQTQAVSIAEFQQASVGQATQRTGKGFAGDVEV